MKQPDCTWDRRYRAVCDCGAGVFERGSIVDSLAMLMPFLSLACLACGERFVTPLEAPLQLMPVAEFVESQEAGAHRFKRRRESARR